MIPQIPTKQETENPKPRRLVSQMVCIPICKNNLKELFDQHKKKENQNAKKS